MKPLVDKLWVVVEPYCRADQVRKPDALRYMLCAGTPPEIRQAEGLLVALENPDLRSALLGLLAAERWGAVRSCGGQYGYELLALLRAASEAAGERIAMALPGHALEAATPAEASK